MGHLLENGFEAKVNDVSDSELAAVKKEQGVPSHLASCHTALVEGYVIEGHVPAADIKRLLEERPDVKGLAVPGMPMGSPGMGTPTGEKEPYSVLAFREDGTTEVYSSH